MAKNRKKQNKKSRNAFSGNSRLAPKYVTPLTETQAEAFDAFEDGQNMILKGSAGTGKTFLGLYFALKDIAEDDAYRKIVIVRSAVQTRDQGFLKGDANEKHAQFEGPYAPLVNNIMGRGDAYDILKKRGELEFESTSFLRGLTYDNSIILVDEAQSCNMHELDTIMTRLGKNSKIIFCGDTKQDDLIKNKHDVSGFASFIRILEHIESVDIIEFTADDIVRSGIVREYILAREKYT